MSQTIAIRPFKQFPEALVVFDLITWALSLENGSDGLSVGRRAGSRFSLFLSH
ncbi:MAG TPA: hypothetical protein VF783_01190 [Terriglobales bacterium]